MSLLDLIAPGGVPQAVADEALKRLQEIVRSAQPVPGRWEMSGLGGAEVMVKFRTRGAARLAAAHLMTCHEHHFAVIGEGQSIVMSKLASQCLQSEFGPTAQPDPAHGYVEDGADGS
jgi:hypothetical protein